MLSALFFFDVPRVPRAVPQEAGGKIRRQKTNASDGGTAGRAERNASIIWPCWSRPGRPSWWPPRGWWSRAKHWPQVRTGRPAAWAWAPDGLLLLLLLQHLGEIRSVAAGVEAALQPAQHQRERQKYHRHPFGDLGQGVAGARAKQGIRRAAAKGHAGPGVLFRQLHQHQQDQQQADEDQKNIKMPIDKSHSGDSLDGIFDNVSKTLSFQRSPADQRAVHVRLAHQSLALLGLTLPPYWMRTWRDAVVEHGGDQLADERVGVLRLLRWSRSAGADGPDGFVGDDRFSICSLVNPARLPRTWVSRTFSVRPPSRSASVSPTQTIGLSAAA